MQLIHRGTAVLAVALLMSGCAFVKDFDNLEEFEYAELEQGHDIEESVDAAAFAGEIVFIGQFKTPHACFDLKPHFDQTGSTLTLRVTAQARNNQCTQLGAYRYMGAIRRISAGSYTFRLVHVVPGQADQTHSFALVVQ